jgi:hypothetical protein
MMNVIEQAERWKEEEEGTEGRKEGRQKNKSNSDIMKDSPGRTRGKKDCVFSGSRSMIVRGFVWVSPSRQQIIDMACGSNARRSPKVKFVEFSPKW